MKTDLTNMFQAKPTDVAYNVTESLSISLILQTDSYKFAHPFAYRPGIKAMQSYGTARVKEKVVNYGMQMFLKSYLTKPITMADVDAAESFAEKHFGRKLFCRSAWEKVVTVYNGYIPLTIRSMPEGELVDGGLPLYTVFCADAELAWMAAGLETVMVRGMWYPTTIATNDFYTKRDIAEYYQKTGADMNMLPFALHDFGGRGATSGEQAQIGGAAHTLNFCGSDTVEGIVASNFYYSSDMSAFSVYATEHSVQCSFGRTRENAIEYIRTQLKSVKALGLPIASIVLDGYDIDREVDLCCTVLKQEIIDCGAKIVFRPDSGDMLEIVPRILRKQCDAFGYETTEKGFIRPKYVGVIQGDGIDRLSLNSLLAKVTALGFSADSLVFGSGGGLLQKVNRDTFKFAQKTCAILVDGEWIGTAKDPITDPGKKSLEGLLTTVRNVSTGDYSVIRLDETDGAIPEGFEDAMQLVYCNGTLYNETTLQEARDRVARYL